VRTLPRVVPALVAAAVLLTGCAVPGLTPAATPSTAGHPTDKAMAAACTAIDAALSKAGSTLGTALQQVASDPQKALATIQPLAADFGKAVEKVDNPTVRKQADKVVAALSELASALKAAVDDSSKIPGLAVPFGKVQQELTALATLCQGG
jgi:hypothetical protein